MQLPQQQLHFARYCAAAAGYGCARGMVRTHGARIVVGQPYADVLGQQGAPTHRKMLMVERVAASTLTAAASVYMLPLFMYDDLCSLEQMLTSSPPSPQQLYFANIIEVVCDIPYVAGRV